jgi:hypothetical protein
MPKTIKVIMVESCNECPYLGDTRMYYDCMREKGHRFDDDYPAIPSWCRLDGVDEIAWNEVIEEITGVSKCIG